MKIPRHVGCNGVESARFEFEQTVPPVLARDTEIVHFTRKNAERFAVEKEDWGGWFHNVRVSAKATGSDFSCAQLVRMTYRSEKRGLL